MSEDVRVSLIHDTAEKQGSELAEILLQKIREVPETGPTSEWRKEIEEILGIIDPSFLTHQITRRLEKYKIPARKGISFHRFMIEESEGRKMHVIPPGWRLNNKKRAYRFVDELGVRRPKSPNEPQRFSQLSHMVPSVVKAVSGTGGRGTYLVYSEHKIRHVADGRVLNSWEQFEQHANQLMNSRGRGIRDQWFLEELILEDSARQIPARDSKFFCFYGEVLFSLDVIRGEGGSRYAFSLPDGNAFIPGSWDYTYFDSGGPSNEQLELATRISLEIPHPFMRIDMLLGEDELVFGEFTPRPGQFHKFNPEWDRRMGEAWLRARGRLQDDLLSGKQFEAYKRAL